MQWPLIRKRFGLSDLAEISGADVASIQRWQHRGAITVRPIGRGKVRTYSVSEALHVAVIAEMGIMGLTITGKGAVLSNAITWYIEHLLREDPRIDALGSIALVPVPDESDWLMDKDLPRAIAGGRCIILGLSRIADGVVRRYSCV